MEKHTRKFVIAFGVLDQPSLNDDNADEVSPCYGVTNNLFNTEAEAKKYFEEVEIPDMIKNQKECYLNEDDPEFNKHISIGVEDGPNNTREVYVYDRSERINVTSYQVIGIDVVEEER